MSSFNAINDKRRLRAVLDCSDALSTGENLTLTGLGRGIKSTKTKVKHSIKRVCQLLIIHSLFYNELTIPSGKILYQAALLLTGGHVYLKTIRHCHCY